MRSHLPSLGWLRAENRAHHIRSHHLKALRTCEKDFLSGYPPPHWAKRFEQNYRPEWGGNFGTQSEIWLRRCQGRHGGQSPHFDLRHAPQVQALRPINLWGRNSPSSSTALSSVPDDNADLRSMRSAQTGITEPHAAFELSCAAELKRQPSPC